MNRITPILRQLEVANRSILNLIDSMEASDLDISLGENKRNVRELLTHISSIYKADVLIMNETGQKEIEKFYSGHDPQTSGQIKERLTSNFEYLKDSIRHYQEEDWLVVTTSWWGVSYSRYEWMLEILAHTYHHRGQLHTALSMNGKDLAVPLFE
ncbi:DinB family protein [Fictibacillus enclensis]|uniref:DinB family protein n=1 Tax=Fictibacillus enclensis TaxID=1017270 RepID=UPI0025A28DE9|nr:DinB family protein [Fictibacillus enclensis]MDM5198287.1 DinB family protein [Fictibacillus enclensis]